VSEDNKSNKGKEAEELSRLGFFKKAGKGAVGTAALVGAAALMTGTDEAEAKSTWAEYFQKNYRLMTEDEKSESVTRLEKRYSEEFSARVEVDTTPPMEGVLFGYALNIQKCIGCRRCVHACVKENNQSRYNTEIQWIRVIAMEKGQFHSEGIPHAEMDKPGQKGIQVGANAGGNVGVTIEGHHYYKPELVPEKDHFYLPIQCMQCEKPPCVKVCPVRTTYREPDGIVVIDYNWCIGCRMCISACPYWARRFNWGSPNLPRGEVNPDTHYLGNRPRMKGVVEKCTFCIQRTRKERYTACVEVCPVGARKFGNLLDPNSEVRKILDKKRVFRLKAELQTYPKFFYFVD
jgi:Fe-S-cluster-containing dehydrogenase component